MLQKGLCSKVNRTRTAEPVLQGAKLTASAWVAPASYRGEFGKLCSVPQGTPQHMLVLLGMTDFADAFQLPRDLAFSFPVDNQWVAPQVSAGLPWHVGCKILFCKGSRRGRYRRSHGLPGNGCPSRSGMTVGCI